ncbi:hypothetical protein GCM10020001_106490 [Nonomuraea salmonea]
MAGGAAAPVRLPAGGGDASPDPELFTLLAAGLKDEAVARQLGVSLRTVHRRVSELMELLGGAYPVPGGAAGRPPRLGRPCLTTPI